ncbi:dephospho-CoA kinase [Flavobacterium gelidilacus]|uniref:dephospho-CoA kinase n=1 Tax=Flavobacterium gelidilacus TaxID=206041 RepID=UPI00047A012F|nr:dephospho-CoA kinase [Flavobacterium gelidilacus]
MTKIIGLTGGIGSGKTTVANYLIAKGIPVYIADLEARKITESKKVINQIEKVFGVDVIENNKVNRTILATIVFKDKEKLAQLNAIIHPEVKKHFKKWLKSKVDFKFVVKESAILFESGSYKDCEVIILVTAPLETRIERTMKRDNVDRESVLQRINNQMPEEEKKIKSDYIIQNTSLKDTHIQLDELLNYL